MFVLVTGLPGGGKTSLAASLGTALDVPMLLDVDTARTVDVAGIARWIRHEWSISPQ